MNNESKIYVIIGPSASGKDTVYKELVARCNITPIVYYTTRPIRQGEKNGVDYFYVDKDYIDKAKENGTLIEERVYHTVLGDWFYATIDDGQYANDGKDRIIILPPQGYLSFLKHFGDRVEPIYIYVPDGIRLRRSIERDERQAHPNYEETCRRFLSDAEDFRHLMVEHKFLNDNLEDCIEEIIKTKNLSLR